MGPLAKKSNVGSALEHLTSVAGFHLIELVLVLALITVLMSYGVPRLYKSYQNYLVSSESKLLLQSVKHLKAQAQIRGESIVLCPSLDGKVCGKDWHWPLIAFVDVNQNRRWDRQESVLLYLPRSNLLAVNREVLRFSPVELGGSTAARIQVCAVKSTKNLAIVLSTLGRIRVEEQNHKDRC